MCRGRHHTTHTAPPYASILCVILLGATAEDPPTPRDPAPLRESDVSVARNTSHLGNATVAEDPPTPREPALLRQSDASVARNTSHLGNATAAEDPPKPGAPAPLRESNASVASNSSHHHHDHHGNVTGRCSTAMARAPVVFCGNVMDTLGSALYGTQAFLAFVLAFKEKTGLSVEVMMPPLPETQKGRLSAKPLGFSHVFDEPALRARLGFGDDPCLRACSWADSEVQVKQRGIAKDPGGKLPYAWPTLGFNAKSFEQTFENIAAMTRHRRFKQKRNTPPVRVFVETQMFASAMCAATVFNVVTQRAIHALEFARTVRHAPTDTRIRSCAYLFVRHKFAGATKPLTGRSPKKGAGNGVPCANCPKTSIPLKTWAERIGTLLQQAKISCVAVSYPETEGPGTAVAPLAQLQRVVDTLDVRLRFHVVNSKEEQKHRHHRRAANENAPKRALAKVTPLFQGGEMMDNIHQMHIAYAAPLFIGEASSLWSDYLLMKRAVDHRPSAILFEDRISPPWKACDLGKESTKCTGCLFVRGECLAPGTDAHPHSAHVCFSDR